MDLLQKASKLGYKHYTEFTLEELDKLPITNPSKQIEYYFIQKWLREIHSIDITIALIANGYGFYIHKNRDYTNDGDNYGVSGHTYEIALEKGLQEALKLIEIVKEK